MNAAGRLPRFRWGPAVLVLGAGYWLAVAAVYGSGLVTGDRQTELTDFAYLPVDALAAVAAAAASRRPDADRRTRRAWRLLAVAFAVRLAGDGSWWWLEAVRHEDPFPSIADGFFFAFVPLLFSGLIMFPGRGRSRTARLRLSLDVAIVVVGAFMAIWYLVLGPTAQTGAETPLATALTIAYPATDLVMFFGIATVIARGLPQSLRGSVSLLMAGICCYVLGDLGFSYATLHGGFSGGSWPDLAFIGANVLYLQAGCWQLSGARRAPGTAPSSGPSARQHNWPPYLAVALGYALMMWVGRDQSPYGLGGLLVAAVLITVLVLLRQFTTSRENLQLAERFEQLATTDALSGLSNRRHLFDVAAEYLLAATGRNQPLSALIMDVDHFKQINDEFGHAAGDTVIAQVAERIRAAIRQQDLAARYGGDEFVILMPALGGQDALAITRRLAARICDTPIATDAGAIRLTLSIGLADATGCADVEGLLARADEALYEVKRRGRDGVHLAVTG